MGFCRYRNKMLKSPYSEIKVRGFFLLNPIGVKTLFIFTSNRKTHKRFSSKGQGLCF